MSNNICIYKKDTVWWTIKSFLAGKAAGRTGAKALYILSLILLFLTIYEIRF